jgi:prepilin-type N-terminal cleavage/methylation domain-containing protein
MKRAAFTMIELIFVIVILGILAAVAVPKLADVQDDALAATEQSGIGAVRASVQALHGKILLNGATNNISLSISDSTGAVYQCALTGSDGAAGNGKAITSSGYPKSLSLAGGLLALGFGEVKNDKDLTLGLVLEPGNREKWKTSASPYADLNKSYQSIAGPATIGNGLTSTATVNANGSWKYFVNTGNIMYVATTAYTNGGL